MSKPGVAAGCWLTCSSSRVPASRQHGEMGWPSQKGHGAQELTCACVKDSQAPRNTENRYSIDVSPLRLCFFLLFSSLLFSFSSFSVLLLSPFSRQLDRPSSPVQAQLVQLEAVPSKLDSRLQSPLSQEGPALPAILTTSRTNRDIPRKRGLASPAGELQLIELVTFSIRRGRRFDPGGNQKKKKYTHK